MNVDKAIDRYLEVIEKMNAPLPYNDYTKKDIEQMIEDKRKELKGLISIEGALFVITKEHGFTDAQAKYVTKGIVVKDRDMPTHVLEDLMDTLYTREEGCFGECTIGEPDYGGECQYCEKQDECIEETKRRENND